MYFTYLISLLFIIVCHLLLEYKLHKGKNLCMFCSMKYLKYLKKYIEQQY